MSSGSGPVRSRIALVTITDNCGDDTRINRLRCRLIGHAYLITAVHGGKLYYLCCSRCGKVMEVDYR